MFSLVLIDDEPWALRGIREFIDWGALGFTDIRCFDNSPEALEYIVKNSPDAVFSDIYMPPFSGLDLIERCHAEGVEPLFVMVSAYADFSYAKRAIDNGAFSYILKPLDHQELTDVASKLARRLYADRMGKLSRELRTLVLRALTGQAPADDSLQKFGQLFDGAYRVCAAAAFPEKPQESWIRIYDDLAVGIFPAQAVPQADFPMGISTEAACFADVFEKIREALIAFFTRQFYGTDETLLYHREQIGETRLQELLRMIGGNSYSQAKALLKTVMEYSRERRIMLDSVTVFYNNVLQKILSLEQGGVLPQDIRPFSDCFRLFGVLHDARTVENSLLTFMDDISDREQMFSENAVDSVRMAIRYVDDNFREVITLEQLAQKYYISVSYLSRKFKSLTGENLSAYLKNKRIVYACELLASTELSVAEIGNICGYPNCFYFSRTFKKTVGVPPSRYKELRSGQKA